MEDSKKLRAQTKLSRLVIFVTISSYAAELIIYLVIDISVVEFRSPDERGLISLTPSSAGSCGWPRTLRTSSRVVVKNIVVHLKKKPTKQLKTCFSDVFLA